MCKKETLTHLYEDPHFAFFTTLRVVNTVEMVCKQTELFIQRDVRWMRW